MYTILVADDEASMLEGLSSNMNWADLSLEPVAFLRDGLAVMDFLDSRPVDIILTDIRMPHASGIDVAEYVHSRNLPSRIILLSGYREFDDAQKAMNFGVRRYLTKPFLLSALRDTLREIVAELAVRDARYIGADAKDAGNSGPFGGVAGGPLGGAAGGPLGCEAVGGAAEGPSGAAQGGRDAAPAGNLGGGAQGAAQGSRTGDAVALACGYIREHYAEHIALTDVALRVYLNPAYLSRIFSERVGCSFRDYLTRTRIGAAARMLGSTRLHVHEVCRSVGYSDLKHFYRQFKQIMKTTPSEYRRLARKGAAP
ncbi:MAG: response regulator [Clostridiales bacterium]|jgi:two-component system response regulator YesN|nr:response regulator [Clostridiales bacterium]